MPEELDICMCWEYEGSNFKCPVCDEDEIILTSAKTGVGVDEILAAIIDRIPPPTGDADGPVRAMIFDSTYDSFRGAIAYVRMIDGAITTGMTANFFAHDRRFEIDEVGYFRMKREPTKGLSAGDVGYVIASIKDVKYLEVGDTITTRESTASEPLPWHP